MAAPPSAPLAPEIRLGLAPNAGQFALLVVVNAFVGAMVGLERVVVPLLAEREFGLASRTVILSFILSFGVVKALANLIAGGAGDRFGRKPILLAGWLAGLPVPFLILFAPRWEWVVLANLLLGVQQGLCWSSAVIMWMMMSRVSGLARMRLHTSKPLIFGIITSRRMRSGWNDCTLRSVSSPSLATSIS